MRHSQAAILVRKQLGSMVCGAANRAAKRMAVRVNVTEEVEEITVWLCVSLLRRIEDSLKPEKVG